MTSVPLPVALLLGAYVVALVVLIVAKRRQVGRRKAALASWPRTSAVITGFRQRVVGAKGQTHARFYPQYAYTGPDGRSYPGESDYLAFPWPRRDIRLEVAVDPADPGRSVPAGLVRPLPPDLAGLTLVEPDWRPLAGVLAVLGVLAAAGAIFLFR